MWVLKKTLAVVHVKIGMQEDRAVMKDMLKTETVDGQREMRHKDRPECAEADEMDNVVSVGEGVEEQCGWCKL